MSERDPDPNFWLIPNPIRIHHYVFRYNEKTKSLEYTVSMKDEEKDGTKAGDKVQEDKASSNEKEQPVEKVFCVEYSSEKSLSLEPCHEESPYQKWQWTNL